MPNPTTNFKLSGGRDLGNVIITKEYLMTVYPQISNQLITPELWVWGVGSVGDNTTISRSTPVTTFAGGANWKQVSCGSGHIAAIKSDGTLWVWGSNSYGQIGDNTTTYRSIPVTTFAGGTNWKQVSCGRTHTGAVKTDGTLWIWGGEFDLPSHLLGINASVSARCTPITTFAGGTDWKQVSCGRRNTGAIKTDGTLWTWGNNVRGQLGINSQEQLSTPVTTIVGGNNWKQVACGYQFYVAVKTDGTLWTWGRNTNGQVGDNTAGTNRYTPVTTFAGGTNWKQASCGSLHTVAIKTDGTLWIWGSNISGQLGNNTTITISTPVTTFAGGTNWKQVGGADTVTAIKTDGTLWTWGDNFSSGPLGVNDTNNRCTPVTTFAGGTNWKQVASGSVGFSVAAIKTSDDLQGI